VLVYAVQKNSLTVCDYTVNDCSSAGNVGNTAVWVPIASNIVSMRAEYGRDTTAPSMDGTPDTYDQTFNEATYGVACARARVSAIRLVLVARSAQYEKNDVASAPTWASSSAAIDLSSNGDWQHYRYKTFQTVVPIRNVAWQGAQPGC
jgi:type IV pilus assembly protein PilW